MNLRRTWLRDLLFFSAFIVLSCRPINLSTADLGRHLANGRWVFEQAHEVLTRNFYSFTAPENPFINHHWLSGVLFRVIWSAVGFTGLSLFHAALGGLTLVIFLRVADRHARHAAWIPAAAAWLALPLITYRAEVRPEVLSYFLLAVFTWSLERWRAGEIPTRALWALPALMALWVNLHIYFIFAFVVIAAFLPAVADRRKLTLIGVALACLAATLLNPVGIQLTLYPLRIFGNYGYTIVENQSVPFFLKRGDYFPTFSAYFAALIGGLGAALAWFRPGRRGLQRFPFELAIPAVLFGALAMLAIRNFTVFGFFLVPILTAMAAGLSVKHPRRKGGPSAAALLVFLSLFSTAIYALQAGPAFLFRFGAGLMPEANASAEFFRAQRISGPVFNNYDIGGYLIFHLFPEQRVFVDNRPEAYPEDFLTRTYIPMQERPELWKQKATEYGFNAIFFQWHDLTPWGQSFITTVIRDPEWVPVFADSYAVILVRNAEKNRDLIERHRLPPEIFSVVR